MKNGFWFAKIRINLQIDLFWKHFFASLSKKGATFAGRMKE
jgi:hypothetical protein